MQAQQHPGYPLEDFDLRTKGMINHPVDYDEQMMMDAVNHPGIKSVKVFRKKRKARNKSAKSSRRGNR